MSTYRNDSILFIRGISFSVDGKQITREYLDRNRKELNALVLEGGIGPKASPPAPMFQMKAGETVVGVPPLK